MGACLFVLEIHQTTAFAYSKGGRFDGIELKGTTRSFIKRLPLCIPREDAFYGIELEGTTLRNSVSSTPTTSDRHILLE